MSKAVEKEDPVIKWRNKYKRWGEKELELEKEFWRIVKGGCELLKVSDASARRECLQEFVDVYSKFKRYIFDREEYVKIVVKALLEKEYFRDAGSFIKDIKAVEENGNNVWVLRVGEEQFWEKIKAILREECNISKLCRIRIREIVEALFES